MNRILLAFRCFFEILFHGGLSAKALGALKLARREQAAPGGCPRARHPPGRRSEDAGRRRAADSDHPAAGFPPGGFPDGGYRLVLRRPGGRSRARASRSVPRSLARYVTLQPVIDGVEGTHAKAPSGDPHLVRFIGNVPASRPPAARCATKDGARRRWIFRPGRQGGHRHHRARGNRDRVERRMKIGIDLGTTNSALAYIDEGEAEDRDFPPVHIFETPQLVAAGRVEARRTLPSFLFLEDGQPVGVYAREQGAHRAHAPGALGEILALQSRCRSHGENPAVGFAGDRTRALAGGGFGALHRQIPRGVGPRVRRAAGRAGHRPHRPGVLRRRGARAHRDGRARRGH